MALDRGDNAAGNGRKDRAVSAGGVRKQGRGRGLRTRSGCLTCRKRHVKCDEARPSCAQCSRNQKDCVYATELSDLPNSRPWTNEHQSPPAVRPQSPGLDYAGGREGSPDEPHGAAASQPSHDQGDFDPVPTNMFNYTSPGSVETNSACQPVGIATARWFGMLAGDAELEIEPSPQQETHSPVQGRSNEPSWPSGQQPTSVTLTTTAPTQRQQLIKPREDEAWHERLCWQSPTLLTPRGVELGLFNTFVQRTSPWLDLFDPYQNFASLVPRLALWNVGLLNAVLTLSVRYQSLMPDPTTELSFAREDALQYYHDTLHYVRKAMQYQSYHVSDELLATTIIISAYEMLDGSSRDWERHLQGVFWIQRSQVIHGDSGGLRAAIWWIWLCQDVWAAFRDQRKVFTFWKPQRVLSQLGPSELAARAVFILGRVINYCAPDDANDSINNISDKARQADALFAMLDEWRDLLTPHFTPLPCAQACTSVFEPILIHPPMYSPSPLAAIYLTELIRLGVSMEIHYTARILLLRYKPSLGGLHESLRRQNEIDGYVGKIGGIAGTLSDYASSTLSSQCLYIAGLSTFNQQYRDEILRLISACRSRTGWPAIPMDGELQKQWGVA